MTQIIDPTSTLAAKVTPPAAAAVTRVPQTDFERQSKQVDAGHGTKRTVQSILTRRGMEEVIRRGQSVMFQGQVLTSVDQLPTDDQLALMSGDSSEVDRVKQETKAEIARLRERMESMERQQAAQQKASADAQAAKATEAKTAEVKK